MQVYVESTILDTLYYTFFQFDRWTHWDRFEFAKEGTGKYLPGWLGVLDLSLYSVAACCVLLSFFGQVTGASAELSWVAIIGLPHYISDACMLEMKTLKLVIATFEWKLLMAQNFLFCLGLSDLFGDWRVVGVWLGCFPGFLLVSCMDAVTFTATKTRRTMTLFLLVVVVPLLLGIFVGIGGGGVAICPRELVCSRSQRSCSIAALPDTDTSCHGGLFRTDAGDGLGSGSGADTIELVAGDTYTLVSNLGLTTTALTTLILFQLKYAFYWCRYRDRTMLLAVYIQREVHDAKDHGYGTISLRGRSRVSSMWSDSGGGRISISEADDPEDGDVEDGQAAGYRGSASTGYSSGRSRVESSIRLRESLTRSLRCDPLHLNLMAARRFAVGVQMPCGADELRGGAQDVAVGARSLRRGSERRQRRRPAPFQLAGGCRRRCRRGRSRRAPRHGGHRPGGGGGGRRGGGGGW